MQVVILAGGLGTRLQPLTYQIPKAMAPFSGKPFLWYQLMMLKNQGFEKILLLTGYLGEQIRNYFQDGSSYGLKISYSQESRPMGTGGALKQAENLLEKDFLLMYGDTLLPIDCQKVKSRFQTIPHWGLVVVYNNKIHTGTCNNIALDKDDNIINYDKQNKTANLKYADASISFFQKKILRLIPENKNISLEQHAFPQLIKKKQLKAYITRQRFYDIGSQQRILEFQKFLCQAAPRNQVLKPWLFI